MKCSVTVSKELPFDWQREYAPLWEGRNEGHLNDILFGPGPDDVLIINGIRAPFRDHLARAARERVYNVRRG